MGTNPLKINIRNNKGQIHLAPIKEMAKEGTFVEIESNIEDDITTSLQQVKKIQSGELPKRSVKQILQDQ